MSSTRYEKQVCEEEEGSYHRREYSHGGRPVSPSLSSINRHKTHRSSSSNLNNRHQSPSGGSSRALRPVHSSDNDSDASDNDNYEEWTTSKRKVNHKTRQVETRVSRQLLMEDGRVIADSGPQVTTRIKEDNKVEECEREKAPKNKGRFEALDNAPESAGPGSGRVLGEKKEIQRVSREVREENMQYHDERFKELTGADVHRRAAQAPHELITINDEKAHQAGSRPRGKMVHYSNKGKKYQDTDEILEVAKLAIDGSITKERKHTKHHEEFSDDEKPDEKGEAETLRKKPVATRSSRKHFDYVNDFDDFSTPSSSDEGENQRESSARNRSRTIKNHSSPGRRSTSSHAQRAHSSSQVFPRYDRDPLLNSLHDEDFKPSGAPVREHRVNENYAGAESSDSETLARQRHQQVNTSHQAPAVEIPQEYRVNKERLLSGSHRAGDGSRPGSHLSSSHRSRSRHAEDAGVQVHLTDEEEQERRSHIDEHLIRATKDHQTNASHRHSKSTHLEGKNNRSTNHSATQTSARVRQRAPSVESSRSSSLDSLTRTKLRADTRNGAQSRDSGFKSPESANQWRSNSGDNSKHRSRDRDVISPTPSAGQRSVKTTTTTFSAGLAERPPRRHEREQKQHSSSSLVKHNRGRKAFGSTSSLSDGRADSLERELKTNRQRDNRNKEQQFDNISVASLNPNATTIRVPYNRDQHSKHESERTTSPAIDRSTEMEVLQSGRQAAELARLNNLRNRLESIQRIPTKLDAPGKVSREDNGAERGQVERFDYRTFVANMSWPINEPADSQARRVNIINNNVHAIVQQSPFKSSRQQFNNDQYNRTDVTPGVTQLSVSASIEPSSSSGFGSRDDGASELSSSSVILVNKNSYMLNQFIKADNGANKPAIARTSSVHLNGSVNTGRRGESSDEADDRRSMLSSNCSLRSSRTYNVRVGARQQRHERQADESFASPEAGNKYRDEALDGGDCDSLQCEQQVETLETCPRAPAWIFNPNDGTSLLLKAPGKPPKPKLPETKTEQLAESRGGRSYYLELIEPASAMDEKDEKKSSESVARPSSVKNPSMDSYSRWSSMNTLSSANNATETASNEITGAAKNSNKSQPATVNSRGIPTRQFRIQSQLAKSSPKLNASDDVDSSWRKSDNRKESNPLARAPLKSLSRSERQICAAKSGAGVKPAEPEHERPSPQVCIPFGSRAKSSSCLLSPASKPSKYSIYGGLRSKDWKPVPRLSYSRAIGPRSQRPNGLQQVKTEPSRYLKMK